MTTAPVTIEQAAALLGVSSSTIRRRIRAGSLQVTETRRPQGTVWLVHLPPGVRPATATDTVDTASVTTTASTDQSPGQPAPAPSDAILVLVQTTIATVLGPLVGQLDAQRQTIERQADRIAELERENGRLTERLAPAPPESSTAGSGAAIAPDPPIVTTSPRTWLLARWGYVLIVLGLLAGAALVWSLGLPR